MLNAKTLMLILGTVLFLLPDTSPIVAGTLVVAGFFGQDTVLSYLNKGLTKIMELVGNGKTN